MITDFLNVEGHIFRIDDISSITIDEDAPSGYVFKMILKSMSGQGFYLTQRERNFVMARLCELGLMDELDVVKFMEIK